MNDKFKQDQFHRAMAEEYECEYTESYDEEAEILIELIDEIGEEIMESLGSLKQGECPCCLIKSHLFSIYKLGFEDGRKQLASTLGEIMDDIIFEE